MKFSTFAFVLSIAGSTVHADEPLVRAVVKTDALYSYEDAPATPDADDPAVWLDARDPRRSLVIGTAKDAGIVVYDLEGRLLQAMLPPNAPQVLPADPPTPAGVNLQANHPCSDSVSGRTFGRYNNVDVAYHVRLGSGPHAVRADVAVVSDRGCDRIRFFRIDPTDSHGPLLDITAATVPRVFPERYDQPSALQPSGAVEGWTANPVDDQNTVYGLTVAQGAHDEVFVSERERGLVRQLRIEATSGGKLTYRTIRTFLFDTSFNLSDGQGGRYPWTPCRESANEEPQSEGLVFDSTNKNLYVAFETIGLYRIPISSSLPGLVKVGVRSLIEPLKSFGQPYRAVPDADEFECEYNADGTPAPEDIEAFGTSIHAGAFLEADLEGLSIIASLPGQLVLLASSQGDSSFHFYAIGAKPKHLGSFLVEGVGDTDGVHYVPVPLGRKFPLGLLVVQNGEAPDPADTGDINGFEFDGATRFEFVSFRDALEALR